MLFNEITSEEFAEIRAKEAAKEAAKEYYGKGIEEGKIIGLIETCQGLGLSRDDTRKKLEDKLPLSAEAAEDYMTKFWK